MARKLQAGMPLAAIAASDLNRAFDAGDAYAATQLGGSAKRSWLKNSGVDVLVRNDTGSDQPQGAILTLQDMLIDDDLLSEYGAENLVFSADAGTGDSSTPEQLRPRTYGALLLALPEDEIGLMRIDGLCKARINFNHYESSATSEDAYPDVYKAWYYASETSLRGGNYGNTATDTEGARILWKPTAYSESPLLCAVQLGYWPVLQIGKTLSSIPRGTHGAVKRYTKWTTAATTEAAVSSGTDYVRNWFGDVESGVRVGYIGVAGQFYMITAACAPG